MLKSIDGSQTNVETELRAFNCRLAYGKEDFGNLKVDDHDLMGRIDIFPTPWPRI